MTGFELRIFGIGSDCSTNWAATTAKVFISDRSMASNDTTCNLFNGQNSMSRKSIQVWWWLDSNRRPLELKATALPMKPTPVHLNLKIDPSFPLWKCQSLAHWNANSEYHSVCKLWISCQTLQSILEGKWIDFSKVWCSSLQLFIAQFHSQSCVKTLFCKFVPEYRKTLFLALVDLGKLCTTWIATRSGLPTLSWARN